ncbi:MAG TPA: hypothetical protein PLC64_15425 [Steroidobacteraceae bacterium]|nr:hypothetical protein [Steroidobacteraceae bacterium]HQX80095.1 hypothetical protein [Steroidobacteraceae bacterium]
MLLLAQLGAEAHAYTHFAHDNHGAPTTPLCGACLSFAPLQGAAGSSPLVLPVDLREAKYALSADSIALPCRQPAPAFRSRAPPALLRAN